MRRVRVDDPIRPQADRRVEEGDEKKSKAVFQRQDARKFLWGLLGFFLILLLLAATLNDDIGNTDLLNSLGWRTDRVALVTVANFQGSGTEYGAIKTAFSYVFSVDNKARYCNFHQYDLNVDASDSSAELKALGRSNRFRKLTLLRELWDSYDWLIWMDLDAIFMDPSVDVMELIDKSADIHFTLENDGSDWEGNKRVNTGFFVTRTSDFARDFFELAWKVNDCGQGLSDQRSINFVLGYVNKDDVVCNREAAPLYKQTLLDEHGGKSMDQFVRFYPKSQLNAFPRDVSKFMVPLDLFTFPPKGDERSDSLVVHFAGQYGAARTTDGAVTTPMLVQYVHLIAAYHARFLDRLMRLKGEAIKHTGPPTVRHVRGKPPKPTEGPAPVQEFVAETSGTWFRDIQWMRKRVGRLEKTLRDTCLKKVRDKKNLAWTTDLETGHKYMYHVDPQKTCKYDAAVKSIKKQLHSVLPDSGRWPTSLFCYQDTTKDAIAAAFKQSHLWIEMGNPSNIRRLSEGSLFDNDVPGTRKFISLLQELTISPPSASIAEHSQTTDDSLLILNAECGLLDLRSAVVVHSHVAYSAFQDSDELPHMLSTYSLHIPNPSDAVEFKSLLFIPTPPTHRHTHGQSTWLFTLPLVLLLHHEMPSDVKFVVEPPMDLDAFARILLRFGVPTSRVLLISRDGRAAVGSYGAVSQQFIYAENLLTVYTDTTTMCEFGVDQVWWLREGASRDYSAGFDPWDDLVIIITSKPSDQETGTFVENWDDIIVALRDALPNDHVVTYSGGLKADDYSATELFRRAKMFVAPGGVLDDLLMAMFSSEGVPLLELQGRASFEAPFEFPLKGSSFTQRVASGMGLNIHTIRSDSSTFDPKAVANAARAASGEHDNGRIEEHQFEADGGEADRGEVTIEFVDEKEVDERPSGAEKPTQTDKEPDSSKISESDFIESSDAKLGLYDRDNFGDFLDAYATGTRGAIVGVGSGHLAHQIMKSWTRCEKLYLIDQFDDSHDVGKNRHDLAVQAVTTWASKVTFVQDDASAAAKRIQQNSLSLVYIDSDDTFESVTFNLLKYWPKLMKGGVMAGNGFCQSRKGVAQAAMQFAEQKGLQLYVTKAQPAHKDVHGTSVPEACPTWYVIRPDSPEKPSGFLSLFSSGSSTSQTERNSREEDTLAIETWKDINEGK